MSKQLIAPQFGDLLAQSDKILVGFSGGLDSAVLLHVLVSEPNLKSKIYAVHVHHGLSEHADQWLAHCQTTCASLDVPLVSQKVTLDKKSNVEANARKARYHVFSQLIEKNTVLVLAHHQNDQAETLLLNLFRGTGVDGLAAMPAFVKYHQGHLLRPFLNFSRAQLETYAKYNQLVWIDDPSNQEVFFTRNYIRHRVLPFLLKKWPTLLSNLTRTAENCQEAKANLFDLALLDCPELKESPTALNTQKLQHLNFRRLKNVIKTWLSIHKIQLRSLSILQQIMDAIHAGIDKNPVVKWGNVEIRRYQEIIYLVKSNEVGSSFSWENFPDPLILPNAQIKAEKSQSGICIPSGSKIEIRFRKGGEEIRWHGQTKCVKKLMQQWKISPWLRGQIPFLYIDNQLAAIVGFAIGDCYFSKESDCTYQISSGTSAIKF